VVSLTRDMVKIGIIGGSGLEDPQILKNARTKKVMTKWGAPSSLLTLGQIEGVDVVILSRHDKDHSIPPSQVPNRANIIALKEEGCTHILATTAVGSLRDSIEPGHLVFPDQYIDRTSKRHSTFYDEDSVCHIPMAEPFCRQLRSLIYQKANELGVKSHSKGTVITIEGPRFSTKAESRMFRSWGADIINMSTFPEVTLAREAGICYASIAMSTDYDCFKDDVAHVTLDEVLAVMKKNADNVKRLLLSVIPAISYQDCACREDIKTSLIKQPLDIKQLVRTIPNFPKEGIMFRDITTLLKHPEGFSAVIDQLVERYSTMEIDVVAGIESRGFILGAALAHRLKKGFIPIRKAGKLPFTTESVEYSLEYGTDKLEIHTDAISHGDRVLLVDDLLATGGTASAAISLIEKLGGIVVESSFVITLPELKGREKITSPIFTLINFEGH